MIRRLFILLVLITCSRSLRGQAWTSIIDSIPFYTRQAFYCATVDTVNQTLYLGGSFAGVNQFITHGVIRYNGSTFDTLQGGTDRGFPVASNKNAVRDLVMYKGKLYVFGEFAEVGPFPIAQMARWNGTSWDNHDFKARGTPRFGGIYNDELYVTGVDSIEGIKVNAIARFDGTNWYDLGVNFPTGSTLDFFAYFKGTYYKSGQVTASSSAANLAYSDGTNWVPWVGVSGDVAKDIRGIKVIDTLMWVYGRFNSIAGTNCKGLAAFSGTHWYGFGQGLGASNWQSINNIQKINGEIYISGLFDKIENVDNSIMPQQLTTNLAKFDGQKWCIISPPNDSENFGVIKYKNNIYAYTAAMKLGSDSVWSVLKYNGGFTPICSQNVNVSVVAVGLSEILNFGGVKIYPNPAKDFIRVESEPYENVSVRLELLNSLGQTLHESNFKDGAYEIDIKDLKPGVYFLRLSNSETNRVFKVVKE